MKDSRGDASDPVQKPKIYIDSVPSGATVHALSKDDKNSREDKVLGTTPLILDPDQIPNMRFCIMIDIREYLAKVGTLENMKDWAEKFRLEQQVSGLNGPGSAMTGDDYFAFDVPESILKHGGEGLVSMGPVYHLNWPVENRICAMFIPRKIKLATFFPLMPPTGTFKKPSTDFLSMLLTKYHFSLEQVEEASESLVRCGKYITRVKDGSEPNQAREFSITRQGAPEESIITTSYDVTIYPGIND